MTHPWHTNIAINSAVIIRSQQPCVITHEPVGKW